MTNLTATPGWDDVPRIETTTPLLGGDGGPLNGAAQALINRTQLLRGRSSDGVTLAKFLTTDTPTPAQVVAALQAAINSGAKRVFISKDYAVDAGVTLAANQVIDFDGGSLTPTAGAVAPNGILYAPTKANVKIVDPVINCAATTGLPGINFVDSLNAQVVDGYLTKCNLLFQASSNSVRMGYKARGIVIDMAGFLSTACYVSSASKVSLSDMELFGGKEGVGIYNNARDVKQSQIDSHNHTQDAFVVIAGQRIDYQGCFASSCGQSGFTTQRQTGAENTKRVTYTGCQAYDNVYDGFDLRGADATPWNSDMMITATGCISSNNGGTGFFVVNAEGVTLDGCLAFNNYQQNFAINKSNRAQLVGCRSVSGASGAASGVSRAGIIISDSNSVTVQGCHSSNENGLTQDYGISFTGTSLRGQVIGGYYENNVTSPYSLVDGNRLSSSQSETLAGSSVFLKSISFLGIYDEEGFGEPSHTRPKGSTFIRTDGGGGELYVSNGAGSWTAH
jgi:hypothetical protein